MLQVSNLSYRIMGRAVLDQINFELNEGDFVFLIGPSGAGKTTLLNLLHGSIPLQEGTIELSGLKIRRVFPWKLLELRRNTGYVFQDFMLLENHTVSKNIALPLLVQGVPSKVIRKRLGIILKSMYLENLSNTRCRYLSGGEKQRVAIARAIVGQPKLILADEPTGNLDSQLALRIMKIFAFLNQHGSSIIFASHNLDLLSHVPKARVLFLENGKLSSHE